MGASKNSIQSIMARRKPAKKRSYVPGRTVCRERAGARSDLHAGCACTSLYLRHRDPLFGVNEHSERVYNTASAASVILWRGL